MTSKLVSNEILLSQVNDLIRSAPPLHEFRSSEHLAWIGRATAVVEGWGNAMQWNVLCMLLNDPARQSSDHIARQMLGILHQAGHDIRLRSGGHNGIIVDKGNVFEYFDEVRKILEGAQEEVLFVDPYLDVEFASRYLRNVRSGVSVRLLTKPGSIAKALSEAAKLIEQQHKILIELRTFDGLHDRHLIVDRKFCYVSGASFKDGGKNAPAILHQIVDTFDAVHATYETRWLQGKLVI